MKDLEKIEDNCDVCLRAIKYSEKKYYFHTLDEILKQKIKQKQKDREDYLLCRGDYSVYNSERFKDKVKTLRNTKCKLCQKFVLKDDETYSLYYLLIESDLEDKENDKQIETFICLDCWNKNKSQYYLDKYWIEVFVNPDRIMGFEMGKRRFIDLKSTID